MMFRNLQSYRLPSPWQITADELENQLSRKRFHPCGSQDRESRGWISPVEGGALVHRVGGHWLIALGIEQRLLPSAVVRQEADARAEEMAVQQGYRPGRRQMQELREQVTQEFLPRAFTRRKKVFVWIDPAGGWLAVDAPGRARAEETLEALRQSLDTLPLSLLHTDRSPTGAMADWLEANEAPVGFSIDQDCELRSVAEDKAAVRYVHHTLEGDEVRAHLAAGKRPTRLALTFDDRISFILTDGLEIKRLEFLDGVMESLERHDIEDEQALFDARFALMAAELSRLLSALIQTLEGM